MQGLHLQFSDGDHIQNVLYMPEDRSSFVGFNNSQMEENPGERCDQTDLTISVDPRSTL